MRPTPITLEGVHIRLVPLSLDHLDDLCMVGLEEDLWRWTPSAIRTRDDLHNYIATALDLTEKGTAIPFAIVDRNLGRAIGSTRYGNITPEHRRLEIGWTWIGRPWQRTAVNTEAKYLLLGHAFESLGCIRVELKTDALNHRSRTAILRIGAREEGTLRSHIITASGRIRDTVYYSILDDEWPEIKHNLESRLAANRGTIDVA